jgi:ferredoxin-NADP reductase
MIQSFRTKLTRKELLKDNIYLLEFILVEPEHLQFQAGQYMMLLCPQPDGTNINRLYSIASPPQIHDTFELLVEIVPNGVASNYVLNMNIGENITFRGPAGMFMIKRSNHRVFVVTGTGIAPIRSILNDIVHGDARADTTNFLFWGVPYLKDAYFLDELKEFTKNHPSFEFFICLSQEQDLHAVPEEDQKHFIIGRVNVGLERRLGKDIVGEPIELPADFDYYVCGGRDVVESLRNYLYSKHIPKDHVIFEKF